MIKTVTRPHEDRKADKERPWAIVVRTGSGVQVHRFKTQSKALESLGFYVGKGHAVV